MRRTWHIKRLASLSIVFAIMLSLVRVNAFAVTQFELEEIQQEKNELTAQREQCQVKIDELQARQASALEQKAALDERNQYALKQVQLITEQVELYNELIAEKAEEVEAAKEKEQQHLKKYRARVRVMEENSEYNVLEVIFTASSFSEMLTAAEDIGEIMQSDEELMLEYMAAREETGRVVGEYEQVMAEYETMQKELQAEQAELQEQVKEAYNMVAALKDNIDSAIAEYKISVDAESEMAAYFDEMSKKFAEEQLALEGEANNPGFIWPAPDCKAITSKFGYRWHPILNCERFHAGLDIGSQAGDVVIAAYSGIIAEAQYSDSYGNYVLINHGNGYSTIYAHMSSIAVEAGQPVSQGDTIGYVGSTGWSTAPHLHFEIRYSDVRTDPATYFDDLTYRDG